MSPFISRISAMLLKIEKLSPEQLELLQKRLNTGIKGDPKEKIKKQGIGERMY